MASLTKKQIDDILAEMKTPIDELALPIKWPSLVRFRAGGARLGEFFILASGPGKPADSDRMHFLKQRLSSTNSDLDIGVFSDTEASTDWTPAKYEQAQSRILRQGHRVVILPCTELPVGKSRNVREGRYAFKVKGRHTRQFSPHQIKQLEIKTKVWDALKKTKLKMLKNQ